MFSMSLLSKCLVKERLNWRWEKKRIENRREYKEMKNDERKNEKGNVENIWTHRWSQSHTMSAKCWKRSPSINWWSTHMCCVCTACVNRSINSDRYFTCCRAQFLIQSSIRSYPHVVFSYFHLRFIGFELGIRYLCVRVYV